MNIAVILTIIISVVAVAIFVGVAFLVRETREENEEKKLWKDSYDKAEKFIKKLTLQEKINLLYGTENMKQITPIVKDDSERQWLCVGKIDPMPDHDFKGMCLQDGPAGVRCAKGSAISYQGSSNTAATFNKTLFYLIGKSQGEECKIHGINTLLAPSMNLMRSPQGGRGWEGFGEDPYLSGVAGAQVTKGIQDAGVIACIKHFVANDQETYRKASSSNMDVRTLMDIYVEPFYRAIKDGHAGSVMASYNAINNTYVYESKWLLTHVLREICGFQGFVVSDWWEVVSNTTATIEAGLDMNMPGGYDEGPYGDDNPHLYDHYGRENSYWATFNQYVQDGKLEEKTITQAATRIIAAMYQMNQMDDYPSVDIWKNSITPERTQLQREAATQSQVLLQNNDKTLPIKLSSATKILVLGSDAKDRSACNGEGDFQCLTNTSKVYNGHMPLGYGSGTTDFGSNLVDPLSVLEGLANTSLTIISSTDLELTTNDAGVNIYGVEDITKATDKMAIDIDYILIFVSADSGEEYIELEGTIGDRPNLTLFHQCNEFIEAIYNKKVNLITTATTAVKDMKIIVIINAPSAVDIPWKDKVDAIIFSGFPGAQSGNAIVDILFGYENPSGHLPFTWAEMDEYGANIPELENKKVVADGKTFKDIYRYNGVDSAGRQDPLAGHSIHQVNYEDGLYIGQRWFNKYKKKPTYPFGFGLSYTTFGYSGLSLEMKKEGLFAKFYVRNRGSVKGSAVPMLFVTFPDYIGEYPEYILKGFEKVELEPSETKEVTILADAHALSYFSVEKDNYVRVSKGKIKVYIAENGDPDQYKLKGEIKALW